MSQRRSLGGTGVSRFAKIEKSKELADERAKQKRKEEGRALFEYEQLMKKEGIKPSADFLKRKEAYQGKLQAEKDKKFRRQAVKRKRKEAEEAALLEEAGEGVEEGPDEKRKRADTSNPFFKEQEKATTKQQQKEDEMKRRQEEREERERQIAESNRRRKAQHRKLQEKTRRGQPIMANKMNYLMHRIDKACGGK
eukprot:TRINITY_DN9341_c0_g7_i1.p2 TRINITY_DN9341_c0_g7~~TRINITY_DN9341_c0_g7_i1.p2  ORF type:complete len:195 (+),score=100.69 TRINITY_DN9341_c0_g7_i1:256-840(+)